MMAVRTQTFTFHKVSDWQWITGHITYFWSLSRTHLYLALAAVFFGLLIALPLGALATQVPRSYPPILVVTTILYALPSLAVFAFLVGVTGLTDTTVIIPLTAYAVAILVRSVADGLRNVPEEVRVAAVAMGFRPLRRLVSVELPVAVPVIVAGLRVATVASISLVTVGSLIGIGGLGQLFIAGENSDFITEIIAGVVLVAFWALVFDGLLLLGGRLLAPWARRST
jgi:osmoprotectant transport system permease protein